MPIFQIRLLREEKLVSGTSCIYPENSHFYYVPQKPRPSKSCPPQSGNLVKNGGFEDWISGCLPLNWKGSNLLSNSHGHTGIAAVQLGRFISCNREQYCEGPEKLGLQLPASLFQEVHVSPCHVLALSFFSSLWIRKAMFHDEHCNLPIENPPLQVNLIWLNAQAQELGKGISLHIPANTLGPLWSSFHEVSSKVPHNTAMARVSITKSKGLPVLIDDISLHVKV
jgi:hypothetical protein